MSTDNVTPFRKRPAKGPSAEQWDTVYYSLTRASAIVDLLQGAAAAGAIEPPANEEALARTLDVVRDLLEKAETALWPEEDDTAEETKL